MLHAQYRQAGTSFLVAAGTVPASWDEFTNLVQLLMEDNQLTSVDLCCIRCLCCTLPAYACQGLTVNIHALVSIHRSLYCQGPRASAWSGGCCLILHVLLY